MKRYGICLLLVLVFCASVWCETDAACEAEGCGQCKRFRIEGSDAICTKCSLGGESSKKVSSSSVSKDKTLGSQVCGITVLALILIIIGVVIILIIIGVVVVVLMKKKSQQQTQAQKAPAL